MSVFADNRIRAARLLLCAVAAFLLCVSARAVDFTYSGALDPETGLPSAYAETAEKNDIVITETMYYSRKEQLFVYPVGSGVSRVRAGAADGMIVTEPVRLSADDGVTLMVYRDGAEAPPDESGLLSAQGKYLVSAKEGDTVNRLFSFTIIGERASLAGGYPMPEGFYILEAACDGEDTYFDRNYIAMDAEGTYRVEYICPNTGVRYTLVTTIDRTPPAPELVGKRDRQGRFHSAVEVRGLANDDAVTLTRDGEAARFPLNARLEDSGIYTLEAFDSAGNSTAVQFTILVYFDLNSLLFFALVCFSVAGVFGYMLYKRKHLKII